MILDILLTCVSIFIAFCIGLWYGSKTSIRHDNTSIGGDIVINTTDPEEDVRRIELRIHVAEMVKKDFITFKVINEDSQE